MRRRPPISPRTDTLLPHTTLFRSPKDDIEADTLMLGDETLAPLRDGEFLRRSIYLSMDATNRMWLGVLDLYMEPVQLGNPMIGFIAAEIVESRHPDFPVGSFAAGILPWSDFIISDGSGMQLLPNIPGLNMADAFGILAVAGPTDRKSTRLHSSH